MPAYAPFANNAHLHARFGDALRTSAPAAVSARDLVCRRSWPTPEAIAILDELGDDPRLACDGWLDSTLDLRDGLSVLEVFAATDVQVEAVLATMMRR